MIAGARLQTWEAAPALEDSLKQYALAPVGQQVQQGAGCLAAGQTPNSRYYFQIVVLHFNSLYNHNIQK